MQGYLYDAWTRTAKLAKLLGHDDRATQLISKAEDLKNRFQKDFWMADRNYMCIALDGDGKQCDASASNPGHTLSTGILSSVQNGFVPTNSTSPEMNSRLGRAYAICF